MFEMLKRDMSRFLDAIENGQPPLEEAYDLSEKFEPILTYFLLRFLREKYPIKENLEGAGFRLLELVKKYDSLASCTKYHKKDSIYVEWFEHNYDMKDFFKNRNKFIELILEKLEG